MLVSDDAIVEGQRQLWQMLRVLAEPAAAVGAAALLSGAYRPEPDERVGLVVTGANASPSVTDRRGLTIPSVTSATMGSMCGRFAVTTDPALLAEKIKAIDEATNAAKDPATPNYNVAPTTTISTVVKRHAETDDESTRRVRQMRWGLVPPWVKTGEDGAPDTKGPLLINARSEKLTTSPAFRGSAKGKRCLVPMDGWYEWRPNGELASGKKAPKTPFYMYGGDGELLFMAGLWSTWRPTGSSEGTRHRC